MIQLDRDGVTLFYVDSDGQRVAHNYLEGAAYDAMLQVLDAQKQAVRENAQAAANYKTALASIQASVDAGRDHDAAPPKPLAKSVSDTGVVSYAPFAPPLPDLIVPKDAPKGNNSPFPAPVVDKQAIMYNMILAMFRKMFPEA